LFIILNFNIKYKLRQKKRKKYSFIILRAPKKYSFIVLRAPKKKRLLFKMRIKTKE